MAESTSAQSMLKMIGIMAMSLMILTDSTIALEASGKASPLDEITQKPSNTIYPVFLNLNEASKVGNNTRIVGGTWVKRGAHPYQAAMIYDGAFNCGGTLIDNKHILTAAHCLDFPNITAEKIKIHLLTTVLDPLDSTTITSSVRKFIKHENYNASSFENDIAILTLEKPVSRVRPVKLEAADPRKNHIGQTGLVIGWGRTRQVLYPNLSSGPASNHLRQVNVTIIRAQDCKIFYYDEYDIVENGGRMCAITLQGKGICQGDSGGPLFLKDVQIGINSAAAGCADPRFPAIFTRVSFYREWITKNTK